MITAYDSTIVGFGRQEFLVKYALDKNYATCFVAVDTTDRTKVTDLFQILSNTTFPPLFCRDTIVCPPELLPTGCLQKRGTRTTAAHKTG